MSEMTPLMKQYGSVKERHADAIVFFRLGDFYEMFGEDAKVASRVLQIALTTRDKGKEEPLPMCGVPYFAADSYINKLIKAGYKVAICEQMEDPKEAKGVVRREVVRVITPGTHTPENQKENSYILSFAQRGKKHGIAAADVSTGEFLIYETDKNLADELFRFEPKEVVFPESLKGDIFYSEVLRGFYASPVSDLMFDYAEAYKMLLGHFRVSSLEGFGCEGLTASISAAGALVSYLRETQGESLSFRKLTPLNQNSYMFLDAATQKNLELVQNKNGSEEETLLRVLDLTLTPMGGRFLRSAILRPLVSLDEIRKRLDAVECLYEDYEAVEVLRGSLRRMQDIERLATRVVTGSANARDLVAIKNSAVQLPPVKKALASCMDSYLKALGGEIGDFTGLVGLISKSIVEHPPLGLKDGGVIREGYSAEVDELRALSTKGKDYISGIEAKERQKTGISSLKVGFNRIYGYYIEVTKANLDLVPEHYIRKQTLVSGERFITAELKDYETKVLGAEERVKALEYEIFLGILEKAKEETPRLSQTARSLASLDFLISLAVAAKRHNYAKPSVNDGHVINMTNVRHPVLERLSLGERFIPNDVYMDNDLDRLLVITGPNMAGKSTYMRQIALSVLMAQMGSFVPADEAMMGVVDRIFTRIGASDFLTKGQSTFMVEMIETANILNNATSKSLIILDEVGRGTSTFDGISIAWATAEHIAKELRAKTLFATHYNELTEMGSLIECVKNYNVSVKEWGDEIIFLRRIEKGPADKSYGIHVARLAGLPPTVLKRAKDVLSGLEKHDLAKAGISGLPALKKNRQLELFGEAGDSIVNELFGLDLENISPEEALKILRELKNKARPL